MAPTRTRLLAVAIAGLFVLSGCSAVPGALGGSGEPTQSIAFENATSAAGLSYHGSGSGVGNGNNAVHATDVDNDGWTDLLVMGGDRPALFVNEGGEFARSRSFPTVTADLKSLTVVDYDGDGWDDVILFVVEGTPVVLHNDGGTFERAESALGLGNLTYVEGATTADYDGDGDRDLFVYQSGNWANHKPAGYYSLNRSVEEDNGNPNVLYENTGTPAASRATGEAGDTGDPGESRFERADAAGVEGSRWSLAASFVDLTGDRRPDVHVANDYNTDVVYVNRGDGSFEQVRLGGNTSRNGMASEVDDVDGDGRPDVFVTNIEIPLRDNKDEMSAERYDRIKRLFSYVIHSGRTKGNTLLVNRGDGEFADRAPEYNVRAGGWGWAASLTDFDNDGDRDLVHSTQRVVRIDPDDPVWTYPQVWRRNATGFARVNKSVHGMGEHNGRGLATLDYDHDGDQDVAIATAGGPLVLYENRVERGNAVQFEVVDESGATALGATVVVEAGDRTTTVWQTDENDFFSQESRVEHVGLNTAEEATLTVTWPDGTELTTTVEAGRRVRIDRTGIVSAVNLTGG